jgi:hypothetical protein
MCVVDGVGEEDVVVDLEADLEGEGEELAGGEGRERGGDFGH